MPKFKVYWFEETYWEIPSLIEADDADQAEDIAFGSDWPENPVQGDSTVIETFVDEVEVYEKIDGTGYVRDMDEQ